MSGRVSSRGSRAIQMSSPRRARPHVPFQVVRCRPSDVMSGSMQHQNTVKHGRSTKEIRP